MSTETMIRNQETEAPASPKISPLQWVINKIRRDSKNDAERYLEETKVPHGGE